MDASDVEDDAPAVDTDSDISLAESGGSTQTEGEELSESDEEVPFKPVPAKGGPSATGDSSPVMDGVRIFDNGYFMMKHHRGLLRMYIHRRWLMTPPCGLGRLPTMSKTITPSLVGDTIEKPSRTPLLLKAWMLWRVRKHPDWLKYSESHNRLFAEEADQLVLEVRRIQPQSDGLMGNAAGSDMFRTWAPDVAARMTKA